MIEVTAENEFKQKKNRENSVNLLSEQTKTFKTEAKNGNNKFEMRVQFKSYQIYNKNLCVFYEYSSIFMENNTKIIKHNR